MSDSPVTGSLAYIEIPAPEFEATWRCYADLFGWEVDPSGFGDLSYAMFSSKNGISGGFDSSRPSTPGGVILFIKVDDIDAILAKTTAMGLETVRTKFPAVEDQPDYGYCGIFTDPSGNQVGVWSPT